MAPILRLWWYLGHWNGRDEYIKWCLKTVPVWLLRKKARKMSEAEFERWFSNGSPRQVSDFFSFLGYQKSNSCANILQLKNHQRLTIAEERIAEYYFKIRWIFHDRGIAVTDHLILNHWIAIAEHHIFIARTALAKEGPITFLYKLLLNIPFLVFGIFMSEEQDQYTRSS